MVGEVLANKSRGGLLAVNSIARLSSRINEKLIDDSSV